MSLRFKALSSETHRRRLLLRRMSVVYGALLLLLLLILARLIELQILRGTEYREAAEEQHFGGVKLPAKRGEIFGLSSKSGEKNIFATNTTLDMVYVDPLITDDPAFVADTLAGILLTEEFHSLCFTGKDSCPREFLTGDLYAPAFDPLVMHRAAGSGAALPDFTEARRRFARLIEKRISQKRVTFVPLLYGATKVQMTGVEAFSVPGIVVDPSQSLIYADPEAVPQSSLDALARSLSPILELDSATLHQLLRSRPLRYVPVMRKLPPSLSLRIKEAQLRSFKEALEKRRRLKAREASPQEFQYPLRSIALIAEHWRFYPDTTIASHVVGFVNAVQEPQYGVERTFNAQLRGREGLISTVSDPHGGQILTSEQEVIDPKDGDMIVLTLDRSVQKEVETLLDGAVRKYRADSGQAIVMDPQTGRILAMVNAPLFDSNNYANVYGKEVMELDPGREKQIVVEVFHPETNARIVKDYIDHIFTASGRQLLPEKHRKLLSDLEKLYDLRDIARFFLYIGENNRIEIFPTGRSGMWLKYRNNIGVGAYLNRTVQEIYEPGSVLKPITMAIALDEGEILPEDTYDDRGPVQVDEYTIKNALQQYYSTVTMTQCLAFSINTCMTSVSFKLGPKLFHRALERFGFSKITGIELEDELPGEMKPWREWSRSLLATTSFGQGISATPLQVITAWAALANGGKLLKPTIIDSVIHADGSVERTQPRLLDQVITPQTAETITAMLVHSAEKGFARPGKPPGYRIAGKTGTSQIAGPGGKYESGTGSTIATYAGYAPIDHPRFVILVKIDRSKTSVYGVTAAAPVFRAISEFLFNYYGMPPDERRSTGG